MSFEPFGKRVPRAANPAPQPLMMEELPPIGDLVSVMKNDIAQVEYWRSIYFATNQDVFASTMATQSFVSKDELNDRKIPVAGLVVRKTVERLEIRGWGRDTDDDNQADEEDAPGWVDKADMDMDVKTEIANTLHLDAEVSGQSFALITPSNDKDVGSTIVPVRAGEMIVSYRPGSRWPIWAARFIPGNPLPTTDRTSDATSETVTMTADTNAKGGGKQDQLWVYTEDGARVFEGKGISNDDWQENTALGYSHPANLKGYCPVIPFVIESFLNPESGLHPLVGSQHALDQLMVSDAVQIEFCGFPITYALLDKESALENVMMLLDPKSGANVLEKRPDAFWQLVADSVGQLEAADPLVILKRMDFYIRSCLTIGSLPQSVWKGTESEQSGETVQQERESLLSKIDNRLVRHTPSWRRTWELLAKARGTEDANVIPQWKPPTARDLRNAIELALLMIQAGIKPEYALRNIVDEDFLQEINMEQVLGREPRQADSGSAGGEGGRPTSTASSSGQSGTRGGNSAPGRRRSNQGGANA